MRKVGGKRATGSVWGGMLTLEKKRKSVVSRDQEGK